MKFKSKIFLAPMADVTEAAFRILCSKYGAGLTYTEMISSTALARNEKNKLFDVKEIEKPIAVQLMGNNLKDIKKAVEIVQDKVDLIDFNMGCPMKKIVENGAGAALLKNPEKVRKIVRVLVESSEKPVSIKIRSGWDAKSINALEIAKIIEEEGASMITIHPKTRSQIRSGSADWSLIKKIKEEVNIPVIGNGEVKTPEDVKRMFDETGCDYVMIGRAASKNPYIFKQAKEYLKDGKYGEVDKKKILEEYLKLAERYNSDLKYIKLHVIYMTRGFEGSSRLRAKISRLKTIKEIKEVVRDIIIPYNSSL